MNTKTLTSNNHQKRRIMANINPNPGTSASQKAKILAYMQAGNKITPIEALEKYGCFRLGARIADLKEDGYDIKSQFVTTTTDKRVKAYWL